MSPRIVVSGVRQLVTGVGDEVLLRVRKPCPVRPRQAPHSCRACCSAIGSGWPSSSRGPLEAIPSAENLPQCLDPLCGLDNNLDRPESRRTRHTKSDGEGDDESDQR